MASPSTVPVPWPTPTRAPGTQQPRSIVLTPPKVTWRAVARQWLWSAVIAPFGGVHVEGEFDADGPCVVVANHGSHADTIAMMSASPTLMRVVTVAAQDYWFSTWLRRSLARGLLGAYPVRRTGEGAYEELRGILAHRVAESMSVLVFPEGTRSRDGHVGRFHSGAARLARDFGIPVLPVALVGSREMMPKKGGLPRYSPVEVRVGRPIMPSDDVAAVSQEARAQVVEMLRRPRRPAPVSDVYTVLRQAMSGRRGDLVMFTWGLADALFLPVPAELSQAWIGLTRPELMWRRGMVVVAGSVLGVATTYLLARVGLRPSALWATPSMEAAASRFLRPGAHGYWSQVLTSLPVSLLATESGRRGLPLAQVLVHAAGERTVRMAGVTIALMALEKPLGPITRQHYGRYLLTSAVALGATLRGALRRWGRR
ncbi:1-acyl-sn-glycerol-3-phosphate acyltransferase [Actinomyces sp. 2119]|uniref:1-acyl-sn-glycerol-3-phosphate acyltransferase n=1 Tax=Actinomyces sp. 2119 TaxID=2321393 RepID=UPI000E6CD208|nr:1-acyl-sn-glycerol-3-phosphate acyltransferase [Actinomyces sp. 2119]RJF40238.1 1-acyl-sn-glycerol-3-phosphate acyltransferase [Actinomyces sp. 2119]